MRSFPPILCIFLLLSGCCLHVVAFRLNYGQQPSATAKECNDDFDRYERWSVVIAKGGIRVGMPNTKERQACIRCILVPRAYTLATDAKEVLVGAHGNEGRCRCSSALNTIIKKYTNYTGALEVDYPAKQQHPLQKELPWPLLSKQKTISFVPSTKNDKVQHERLVSLSKSGCARQGSSKKSTNQPVKLEKTLPAVKPAKPHGSFEEMAHTRNQLPLCELPNTSIKQPTLHKVSSANADKSQELSAPAPYVAAQNVPSDRNDDDDLGERQSTSPSVCPLEKCTICEDHCLSTVTIATILGICVVLVLGFGVGIGFEIARVWPNDSEVINTAPQPSPATRSDVEKSITDEIVEGLMGTQNRFKVPLFGTICKRSILQKNI
uniref:MANEC domain-containing protein n=1 Tax=Ascaris lumbricoides TaxID=6252 RepID=A0A0M3I1M0_ASCLU